MSDYIFKVADLIAFYKRDLFEYLKIEYRGKFNYKIKDVNYATLEYFEVYEEFKNENILSYFFQNDNTLVILLDKE